jgi:hypothetical protein
LILWAAILIRDKKAPDFRRFLFCGAYKFWTANVLWDITNKHNQLLNTDRTAIGARNHHRRAARLMRQLCCHRQGNLALRP